MLTGFLVSQFQLLLLIMMRMFGMISVAPFLSSVMIPMRIKAALALAISLVIYPLLSHEMNVVIPDDFVGFIILIINQLVIGLAMGFFISIIFASFQLAGQFFSIQMGFGISEVFDPLSQIHMPLVGQFLALFGTLMFISMGGHLMLIEGVYQSYFSVPTLDLLRSAGPLSDKMLEAFNNMFIIALKISLPIMGTLFIVTLCMGLLAKFAPQMNILMLGFPIYITVGFIMLMLILPFIRENGVLFLNRYIEYLTTLL